MRCCLRPLSISLLALTVAIAQQRPAATQGRPDLVWMRGSNAADRVAMSYSPDNRYFAMALASLPAAQISGVVLICRAGDGVVVRTITHNGQAALDAQFSPDGKRIACVFSGGTVFSTEIFNVQDGQPVLSIPGPFEHVAWAPRGALLALAVGKNVELRRSTDGVLVKTLMGHAAAVTSVRFSQGGSYIASGSKDETVRVWSAASGVAMWTLPASGAVFDVAFSPGDPESLALASYGPGGFKLWRLSDGVNVRSTGGTDVAANIAYSPDGKHIAVAALFSGRFGGGGAIHIYRASDLVDERAVYSSNFPPVALVYSADGSALVGATDTGTYIWRTSDYSPSLVAASVREPSSVTVSHNGKYVASYHANMVHLWDAVNGSPKGFIRLNIPFSVVEDSQVTFLPGDTELAVHARATWTRGNDTSLQIYSLTDLTLVRELPTNYNTVVSPDGSLYATHQNVGGGRLEIRRVSNGSLVTSWSTEPFGALGLAFTPDSKMVAHRSGLGTGIFEMHDATTGALTRQFRPSASALEIIAFSPDGQTMATGHRDGAINLWDVATGSLRAGLPGHGDLITSLRFSPDNHSLLSGSRDNKLSIWSTDDGSLISHYDDETGMNVAANQAMFGTVAGGYSPDNRYYYYGRRDGTIAKALNPMLNTISPSRGGNTGNVTVRIVTAPDFPGVDGATVTLKADGLPNIATSLARVSDYVYTGTFDLRGAPLGKRDVVISGPGVGERTYLQTFIVEAGINESISLDLIGRRFLRKGLSNNNVALIRNLSNQDIAPASLWLSVPWSLTLNVLSGATQTGNYTDDKAIVGTFRTSPLSANSSYAVKFSSSAPDDTLSPRELTIVLGAAYPGINPSGGRSTASSGPIRTFGGNNSTWPLTLPTQPCGPRCADAFSRLLGYASVYSSALESALLADLAYKAEVAKVVFQLELAVLTGHAVGLTAEGILTLISVTSAETIAYNAAHTALETLIGSLVKVSISIAHRDDPSKMEELSGDLLSQWGEFFTKSHIWEALWGTNASAEALARWARFLEKASLLKSIIEGLIDLIKNDATKLTELWNALNDASKLQRGAFSNLVSALLAYGQCCLGSIVGAFGGNGGFAPLPTEYITSDDPNELAGSAGFADKHWWSALDTVDYLGFFQNKSTASAPAADVAVTDHIDPVFFDTTSVQIGSISFAGKTITPELDKALPVGKRTYSADVDLRPGKNLLVHTTCSLDMLTGDLTWKFVSLDPVTMLPPEDPLAGFLDPGEEGSVFFSVQPRATLATGTVVTNQASIKFDFNDWMDTNTWFNTIDADKPVSKVNALSSSQNSASFVVSWQGQDVGSGVRDVTIYVSDNGGAWTPWLTNTMQTSATFTGEYNHAYGFKSQSRDNVYNLEDDHLVPDATTKVAAAVKDVSSSVSVTRGGFRRNATTGRYQQTVTLKNASTSSVTGPMSLVLDSLSSNATLYNKTGTTSSTTPTGRPYINVTTGSLTPGGTASVTLEFTNPTNATITYATRVLAGPGSR